MKTQKVVIYVGVDAEGTYSTAGWHEKDGEGVEEDVFIDCVLDMVGDPYALYKITCEVPLPTIGEIQSFTLEHVQKTVKETQE